MDERKFQCNGERERESARATFPPPRKITARFGAGKNSGNTALAGAEGLGVRGEKHKQVAARNRMGEGKGRKAKTAAHLFIVQPICNVLCCLPPHASDLCKSGERGEKGCEGGEGRSL